MSERLFLSMLKHPATTGAVMPSSRYLAYAMAHAARGADMVVELGAGTGAVTKALLHLLPETPLIAVELQPDMARRLQHRFPQIDVRLDSAKNILDGLYGGGAEGAPDNSVLVSSLPFRSLPAQVHRETAESICAFLAVSPLRKLVQFTYQPRRPFHVSERFRWKMTTVIWRNAPPAGVWELQLAPSRQLSGFTIFQ